MIEKTSPLPPDLEALLPEHSAQAGIQVVLSFEQMRRLLEVLGSAPYSMVADLVAVIRAQADREFARQSLLEQFASLPLENCAEA